MWWGGGISNYCGAKGKLFFIRLTFDTTITATRGGVFARQASTFVDKFFLQKKKARSKSKGCYCFQHLTYHHGFSTKAGGKSHDQLVMLAFPVIKMIHDEICDQFPKMTDGAFGFYFLFLYINGHTCMNQPHPSYSIYMPLPLRRRC